MESVNAALENETSERDAASRLSTKVAITVALLATFLGICKVKDDNLVQAMQQAQADKLDHWSYYQARTIRAEVAQTALTQLTLLEPQITADKRAQYQDSLAAYQKLVTEQLQKRDELSKQAEEDQQNYDALNYRDDQFDLSDTLVALAISLLALTALTHKRWLYWMALVPTVFGVLMGLSGLLGWHVHSGFLARLLS